MGKAPSKAIGLGGQLPGSPGPFTVGSQLARVPGSVHVKIFYPAEGEPVQSRKGYVRKEAVKGLAKGLKHPPFMYKNLLNVKHSMNVEGQPLKPTGDDKFPVVLFSHGLRGYAEMYSKVCADVASYGYVVISMEHEDGSGSYAIKAGESRPIRYKIQEEGVSDVEFRKPHLAQRRDEIFGLMQYIKSPEATQGPVANAIQYADTNNIFLGGHSFGSATVTTAVADPRIGPHVSSVFLLDPWLNCLDEQDPIIQNGASGRRFVLLLSEHFVDQSWSTNVCKFVANSPGTPSFYIPGTTHQQFSDMPFIMNKRLAKSSQSLGPCPKEESQKAIIEVIIALLQANKDWTTVARENNLKKAYV